MNDKEINIALGKLFNGLELKGERVELGLVDEIKKVDATAQNEYNKIAPLLIKAMRHATNAKKSFKKAESKGVGALNMLEDLGIEDKKIEKLYDTIKFMSKQSEKIEKSIDKTVTQI